MRKSSLKSFVLVLCLVAISCGCGDQKKTPATTNATPAAAPSGAPSANPSVADTKSETKADTSERSRQTSLQPTDSDSSKPEIPAKTENSAGREKKPWKNPVAASQEPAKEGRPFPEAKLLPPDIVAIVVAHPMQFLDSPFGKLLTEVGVENFSFRGEDIVSRQMQMRFHEIERVTVVFDQTLIDEVATVAGLQSPLAVVGAPVNKADGEDKLEKRQLKNSMKQIGLAFHMFHDVYNIFPSASGDGTAENNGLSWRVHLLPYLEHAELYNQFQLDEPWDSEHNKPLISKMPAVFNSPGVNDDGKTAFHVFTGERTPFNGETGAGIRNFTDGTSNTILAVLAGPDTAEIWTKPGGLDVDLNSPKKALGEIGDDKFLALFADGSVHELPATIDEVMLANLIQPGDGNVVDLGVQPLDESSTPIPISIFTFVKPPEKEDIVKELLGQPTEETYEGKTIHSRGSAAVWFSDARTVVVGSIESVKKRIASKPLEKDEISPLIAALQLDAEFTAAIDVESQAPLLQQIAMGIPMLGMINNIDTAAVRFSTSGDEGDSLVEIDVTAVDANMAAGLSALANVGLNQAKMQVNQIPELPDASENDQEMQTIVKEMVLAAAVEIDGEKIRFRVPIVSGFERLPELLKPAILSAKTAAQGAQLVNNLKMIGLAFHNSHDVFAAFPGAGRVHADKPVGLSWRVHLLPYLDQAPLYNQFHLDEPWDSDHNKALIEKMPLIFKSPGVDEAGKTSFHVFTGPQAPFADDQTPGISQFTDGTSNTILAVLAGPDTAEIWTKPGGLDFDPDDPIKALGKLIGETFYVLMADGSVRSEMKTIDPANLRRMIQMNDGEPLQ